MKMVAAAKLRAVQNQLDRVRNFAKPLTTAWPSKPVTEGVEKTLIVPITSDRGLCGSVNSAIARRTKAMLRESADAKSQPTLFTIGSKGTSALERHYPKNFVMNISEAYKFKVISFKQVCMLADLIQQQQFDKLEFLYNRFKNLLTFDTTIETIYSYRLALPAARDHLAKFEIENDGYTDVLQNLYEFRTAVRLYHCLQENSTAEQSSRMNAMSNSSKSAGEMLGGLRLVYNRTRQAKITTELIEIVSGAISVEEDQKKE